MMSGPEGLGGIFDDREIVFLCNGIDGGHVSRLPINSDWHDGFRAVGDGGFHQCGVHVPGGFINVDEDGFGPGQLDHFRRGDPGVGDGDDLIARADFEGHEGDEKGVRAAGGSDAVGHTDVIG